MKANHILQFQLNPKLNRCIALELSFHFARWFGFRCRSVPGYSSRTVTEQAGIVFFHFISRFCQEYARTIETFSSALFLSDSRFEIFISTSLLKSQSCNKSLINQALDRTGRTSARALGLFSMDITALDPCSQDLNRYFPSTARLVISRERNTDTCKLLFSRLSSCGRILIWRDGNIRLLIHSTSLTDLPSV